MYNLGSRSFGKNLFLAPPLSRAHQAPCDVSLRIFSPERSALPPFTTPHRGIKKELSMNHPTPNLVFLHNKDEKTQQ